ncbi:MAG: flagellar motor switch phosphatase FliY [Bacilli bacterium]
MMSDDMLSQEEINALLRGESLEPPAPAQTPQPSFSLTDLEKDAIGEVGNISFGNSATALSTLLNQKVEITTPTVSIVYYNDLVQEFPQPYIAVEVSYTEGIAGRNLLIINKTDAAIIADLMLGGDGRSPDNELNEIHLSAVQEAMNQMMGMSATSMSTMFGIKVDISPPSISEIDLPLGEGYDRIPNDDFLVRVSFRLTIGDLIDSNIMQLLPVELAKTITETLMKPAPAPVAKAPSSAPKATPTASATRPIEPELGSGAVRPSAPPMTKSVAQAPDVKRVDFASFDTPTMSEHEARNLDLLYDIQLDVSVELGRTKQSIRDILELTQGSIIELDKLAGEPVEILVSNKLVARGEVVVIEENFGVRVTDIISRTERLHSLK